MPPLSIVGTASFLPPTRSVRALARESGADPSGYEGWPVVTSAGPDDHPSTMGASALATALERACVRPDELSLVIAGSMSRDFVPSWSVAAAMMKICGVDDTCLGIDLTDGCIGGLVGLDVAAGWLARRGGGYAAIVCAERWSWTVDRGAVDLMMMWGLGDGASAVIVGSGVDRPPLGSFLGADFHSHSSLNGRVIIRYGGTRYPSPPPGALPMREVDEEDKIDVRSVYLDGYASAIERTRTRYGIAPEQLVCNQISQPLTEDIARLAGIPLERTLQTGGEIGHLGSVDLLLGIDRTLGAGPLESATLLAGSTPYLFGAGVLVPSPPN